MSAAFNGDPTTTTLEQAKEWLRERVKDGAACPCCTQFTKVYKRKLNSTMARGLIWLVRSAGATREWVDVSADGPKWLVGKGGTLATLHHWALIEPQQNTRKTQRMSGIWRPTLRGVEFASAQIDVPHYVFLYDGKPLRFSQEQTTVSEALGDKFDYAELMAG